MSAPIHPIFFDVLGRRERITNIAGMAGGIAILIVAIGILLSIVLAPSLPSLALKSPLTEPIRDAGERPTDRGVRMLTGSSTGPSTVRNRTLPKNARPAMRLAHFSNQRNGGLLSLEANAGQLDAIFTDALVLDEGGVSEANPYMEREIRSFLRRKARHVKMYTGITARSNLVATGRLLSVPSERTKIIDNAVNYIVRNRSAGIVVGLPWLIPSGRSDFVHFLVELRARLRQVGAALIVQVDSSGSFRAGELAGLVDYLLLRTHDNTHESSPPGPIASQSWYEHMLVTKFGGVPPAKLIVSIGSYGYDWTSGEPRQRISVQQAWNRLAQSKGKLEFDRESLNPGFRYIDATHRRHRVWFLDGVTAFNAARAALAMGVGGLALWELGLEDPSVWSVMGRKSVPDQAAANRLEEVEPSFNVEAAEAGIVVRVQAQTRKGKRTVRYDAGLGLISDQSLNLAPQAARVDSWLGSGGKSVALTFDDGPDRRYSPQILDILRDKGTPATFFVVGKQAARNPHLIQRMYDEGHDIGNHSYSHPNMGDMSRGGIEMELNAVQRVLESQLGVRTILFRAPYSSESYAQQEGALRTLQIATGLGYVHVNINNDPSDWANPTPQQIVSRVLHRASEGGDLILLHDAGGNRNPTIAALPLIIDHLKANGFRFVAVHEMLNRSRHEVMLPSQESDMLDRVLAQLTGRGMQSVAWLSDILPVVAISATILGIARLIIITLLAWRHRHIEGLRRNFRWRPPSLSVLVPAFNEEKVICKTIRSLLDSRHRKFDIIVIDDGSSDRTAQVVRAQFSRTNRVRVFKKLNGGKSAALNYGLTKTEAEIVIALDADTLFTPGSIEQLVRHFADPRVGAVAGKAVVGNEVTLMTRFQSLEYVTSQNLDKRAFELFNAIGVVPGAIGAWRSFALLEVGGYAHDNLAEDADVTLAIERRGWKVLYEPAAVAMTEAPETVRAFLKQRFRWMFGTLQVAFKHMSAMTTASPRGVGLVTIPNILLFQFAFTLLAPLMDILLVLSLLIGLRDWLMMPEQGLPGDVLLLGKFWLMFQTVDTGSAALAIVLDGDRRGMKLVPLILLQRFCYRQLLYYIAARTLLTAVKGRMVGWGKLLRTGNVPLAVPALQAQFRGGAAA
ncbi:MAG: glycosyltransferase [Alphaproteobacteria bacterium]|nr:glycosyltransferase [Alphaproteobacteria bacterium]